MSKKGLKRFIRKADCCNVLGCFGLFKLLNKVGQIDGAGNDGADALRDAVDTGPGNLAPNTPTEGQKIFS